MNNSGDLLPLLRVLILLASLNALLLAVLVWAELADDPPLRLEPAAMADGQIATGGIENTATGGSVTVEIHNYR